MVTTLSEIHEEWRIRWRHFELYFSQPDGRWICRALRTADILATHGDTPHEALQQMTIVCIEIERERSKQKGEEKKGKV